MMFDVGEYIDLTYLNQKAKKKGAFSGQFDASDDNLYEPGVQIVFLNLATT